jgi:hypothetical protein
LQAAQRIVPEWKDFDNEIKAVMQKWQQGEQQKSQTTPPVVTTGAPVTQG